MANMESLGVATARRARVKRKENERVVGKPGVVYVGHLPHGFYEEQLVSYFSQFGAVDKVKVARNKKACGYWYTLYRNLAGCLKRGGSDFSGCSVRGSNTQIIFKLKTEHKIYFTQTIQKQYNNQHPLIRNLGCH